MKYEKYKISLNFKSRGTPHTFPSRGTPHSKDKHQKCKVPGTNKYQSFLDKPKIHF